MNIQYKNGNSVIIDSRRRLVIINATEYPFKNEMKGSNATQINEKVYIDGYQLINGRWKRTLRALWHFIF